MIRTAIISVTASLVLFGAWTVNLVSYHPAPDLNPLAPLSSFDSEVLHAASRFPQRLRLTLLNCMLCSRSDINAVSTND